MDLDSLIINCRSYRRFDEGKRVAEETLLNILDSVRLIGSAKNVQPIRYIVVTEIDTVNELTAITGWAGTLKDWPGPALGERPTAYILVAADEIIPTLFQQVDAGMALQTIMLKLAEKDLGGCIIGAFNKDKAVSILKINSRYTPLYMIAIGVPGEEMFLENMTSGEFAYWRDQFGGHHVPKRGLDEIVIGKI